MTAPAQPRRLYRLTDRRLFVGVAAGIAQHLGVSAIAVRIAFVVLSMFSGIGAVLYVVFWAVLPLAPGRVGGLDTARPVAELTATLADLCRDSTVVGDRDAS